MDPIKEMYSQLRDSWQKVRDAMQAAPDAWKPHLPYSSPAEIDEVVSSLSYLLDRVRAPSGFAPTFHLIRGFAHTSLNAALTSCKALEAGQYTNLPVFLSSLSQILAAAQSMLYYSDHDEARVAIEGLGGKLAEGLALLGTAQRELAEKSQQLDALKPIADDVQARVKAVEELQQGATTASEEIDSLKNSAEKNSAALKETLEEIETNKSDSKKVIQKATEQQKKIDDQLKAIEEIQKKSTDLNETARALLPTAASAGLAAAFSKRVTELNSTKYVWMTSFMVSIASLAYMAQLILTAGQQQPAELWQSVLQRLPFTAPFIWLGWFSAVQYGNTIRVQEDYSFKEATAKAFVGYKDHMDHLANLNLEDTKTAMERLATKTIDILSHEPLRIYQKSSEDVSPTETIFDSMRPGSKQKADN